MRHALSCALVLALSLPAVGQDPKVDAFAPRASGVALAEVVAIEPYDERPMDGNMGVRFELKLVRGSGEFPVVVNVVTEYGGLRPPDDDPKPSGPVKANSLKKGERWWFAFSSHYDYEKYNQGVIGFWPEKDAKAEALDAAVKADAYRWHPHYDSETKLTTGILKEKGKLVFRVERGGRELWRADLPGTRVGGYMDFGLWKSTGGQLVVKMPKCGKIVMGEMSTRLEKDNEFGLPAGPYWINTGFDPETGKRLAAWVRRPQHSHVALVNRRYDPESGNPQFEQRYDFPATGGKAVGAATEDWYRKIERTFDATGKVAKEEVFRYDQGEPDDRWVKVGK